MIIGFEDIWAATWHMRNLIRVFVVCMKNSASLAIRNAPSEDSDYIMKTCLYNIDLFKPHFCTVKLGFTGYTLVFLFLLKNIDCGYSLEPPRRGGSNGGSNKYLQSMFWADMWRISKFFIWKFFSFSRWNFLYRWIGMFFVIRLIWIHAGSMCPKVHFLSLRFNCSWLRQISNRPKCEWVL